MNNKKAVVLNSGGADSSTVVSIAVKYSDHDDELWSICNGFSRYLISTYGKIVRLPYISTHFNKNGTEVHQTFKARILKWSKDQDGYPVVGITADDGCNKSVPVHRLVALTFLDNPENKPTVNHIDGNKLNNHITNLEWATWKENNNHSIRTGLRKSVYRIKCLDTDEIYESINDASRCTGISGEFIRRSIKEKFRINHSYTFIKLDGSVEDECKYLKESIMTDNSGKHSSYTSVICLDLDKHFSTWKEAADYFNVDPGAIQASYNAKSCCHGHVFVKSTDIIPDKQRYMDFCYTNSKFYKNLASQPRYSLDDKAIVLNSGGADSTTCLGIAIDKLGKSNVATVSIFYNQKHKKELECAKKVAEYYDIPHYELDISNVLSYSNCPLICTSTEQIPDKSYAEQIEENGEGKVSTYVPFRNGLMLSAVAALVQSIWPDYYTGIYIGAHADDAAGHAYADCSEEFTSAMNTAIIIGTYGKVRVVAPLVNMNKAEVIATGLKLGTPYNLTYSCYKGGEKACGKCGTCIDRLAAFHSNGVEDPIEYEN